MLTDLLMISSINNFRSYQTYNMPCSHAHQIGQDKIYQTLLYSHEIFSNRYFDLVVLLYLYSLTVSCVQTFFSLAQYRGPCWKLNHVWLLNWVNTLKTQHNHETGSLVWVSHMSASCIKMHSTQVKTRC